MIAHYTPAIVHHISIHFHTFPRFVIQHPPIDRPSSATFRVQGLKTIVLPKTGSGKALTRWATCKAMISNGGLPWFAKTRVAIGKCKNPPVQKDHEVLLAKLVYN